LLDSSLLDGISKLADVVAVIDTIFKAVKLLRHSLNNECESWELTRGSYAGKRKSRESLDKRSSKNQKGSKKKKK